MRQIKAGNAVENIWFTSDTHFSHKNIIKHCFRPFKTEHDMDERLIHNWNSVVGKNDVVFHLGDFLFYSGSNRETTEIVEEYLSVLNGKKHLVIGNHDGRAIIRARGWESVQDTLMVKAYNDKKIILNHFCQLVWDKAHYGSWHLYGHSHGTLGQDKDVHRYSKLINFLVTRMKMHDVGVDNNKYFPISYDDVADIMEAKEEIPFDYHRQLGKGKTDPLIDWTNYAVNKEKERIDTDNWRTDLTSGYSTWNRIQNDVKKET